MLPEGITSGDLKITVTMGPFGKGEFILRGWFEGTPSTPRGTPWHAIREIWELFNNLVIRWVTEKSGNLIWHKNIRRSTTSDWRTNRVSFDAVYELHGLPYMNVPMNMNYFTTLALNWLAAVTRKHSKPITDSGPYGGIEVRGPMGNESLGPVISYNALEKTPEGWRYPTDRPSRTTAPESEGETTPKGKSAQVLYTSYHNHYLYRVDSGRVLIPVLKEDADDIIQQTRNPQAYLIITGEAMSSGSEPLVAPYPYTRNTDALLLIKSEITPEEPSAAGEYKISWKRIYQHKNYKNIEYRWPYTPLNKGLGGKKFKVLPAG